MLGGKCLDVNVRKTKGVQFLDGKRKVTARIDPSGVSGERVGFNSVKCFQCKKRVFCHCSDG